MQLWYQVFLSNINSFQTYQSEPKIGPLQILPFQVTMDLEVMEMKMYSTFSRAPELDSHHQINNTPLFFEDCRGLYPSSDDAVSIFKVPLTSLGYPLSISSKSLTNTYYTNFYYNNIFYSLHHITFYRPAYKISILIMSYHLLIKNNIIQSHLVTLLE